MLDVPPWTAAFSSSSTRAPARAASSAAHPPAMPNPTTTTSYVSASVGTSGAETVAGIARPAGTVMGPNVEHVSIWGHLRSAEWADRLRTRAPTTAAEVT